MMMMDKDNQPPPWANAQLETAAPITTNHGFAPVSQQQPVMQMQQQQQTVIPQGGGGNHNSTNIPPPSNNSVLLEPYSTLDEPVWDTIMRDVHAVGTKLKVVMLPLDKNTPFGYTGLATSGGDAESQQQQQQSQQELGANQRRVIAQLKDWDLWGPLVVCLLLSIILSLKAPSKQAALVFASVFLSVWLGSAVVTINAQLLGGTISFFQSVCVLGYCVFPMTLAAIVVSVLRLTNVLNYTWVDLIILGVGFIWAIRASSVFIASYIRKERQVLATFPVFFFYTFLAWLILLF